MVFKKVFASNAFMCHMSMENTFTIENWWELTPGAALIIAESVEYMEEDRKGILICSNHDTVKYIRSTAKNCIDWDSSSGIYASYDNIEYEKEEAEGGESVDINTPVSFSINLTGDTEEMNKLFGIHKDAKKGE